MSASRDRKRPNSYNPRACERCRSRKQRCLREGESETCRNCAAGGAECIYVEKVGESKRTSSTPEQADLPSHSHDDHPPTAALSLRQPSESQYAGIDTTGQYTNHVHGSGLGSSGVNGNRHGGDAFDWTALLGTTTANASMVPQSAEATRSQSNPITSPVAHMDAGTGTALVTLEAAAEPHYIGESSGAIWSTIVGKGLSASLSDFEKHEKHGQSPTNNHAPRLPLPTDHRLLLSNLQRAIPDASANRVLEAVYLHLHPRYPFMDWSRFDEHWQARDGLLLAVALGRPLNKEAGIAAYFVLMVLAIGSQLCKNEQLAGLLRASEYYTLACDLLPIIVQLHNLANIQGLLLLAMYSLRDSRGPSVWHLSGITMRLCCALGLHREPNARAVQSTAAYDLRMRKRVFWTCYTLDRMMAITLGRPPGISDDDIDVGYPELVTDDFNFKIPVMRHQQLVSAVHHIKLKRIESKIQRAIYSPNNRAGPKVAETRALLQEIDWWEKEIPKEASWPDTDSVPCCSRAWFELRGVEARLHLLRPISTDQSEEAKAFVPLLAKFAAKGCDLQKRTHHLGQPGSSTSAHSTFICGLALLYAIFLQPECLGMRETFGAISAASSTLFAYAQSDPALAALHDVFEELSSSFIDRLGADPQPSQLDNHATTNQGWQKTFEEATNSMVVNGYVDLLQSLGINMPEEQQGQDSLWDLGLFTPFDSNGM